MWSDRETVDDCLGFSSYVESLADVCLEPEIAPLTVGIFGSWGSGKTSLMQMLRAHIDARTPADADDGQPKVVTLWFNAWKYEGKEEIQSALIHAVLRELIKGRTLLDDVMATFDRLKKGASVLKLAKTIAKSAITLTPDFAGFLDSFKDEAEQVAETMEQFEQDFESLLKSVDVSRIIVFIDDLDRCSSDKVVEAFETIKLFLNTPETTFVIGADAPKIEQAIGTIYQVAETARPTFARDYLEKIVQLPFSIPEQRPRDVAAYVGMLVLRTYLTTDGWSALLGARRALLLEATDMCTTLTEWMGANAATLQPEAAAAARDHLARTLAHVDVLVRGLRGNPRQIKRFLNILELRARIAKANDLDVRPELLTKLAAVEYTWRDFFANVVETIGPDGRSELMGEVVRYADREQAPPDESPMLTAALEAPGLAEFLAGEPKLDGTTELTPYLFLAQTALDPKRRPALLPQDELARDLAERMASDDAIRARAAAKNATQQDPATTAAVVRLVAGKIAMLQGDKEKKARVNALQSLETVCKASTEHYRTVVEMLRAADVKDPGFAMAAVRVLGAATDAGFQDAATVKDQYEARSPLARVGAKKPLTRRTN
ncbi:MAG TPA: P-loop NTPase fold protein [Thermoanaerobaculia bacterium]